VRLEARIVKVRTVSTDDKACSVIVELRMKNLSAYPFMIRGVRMGVKGSSSEVEGDIIAEMDLDRVLAYYSSLGPRYNPTLKLREKIAPQAEVDRTVAGSFAIPLAEMNRRQNLIVYLDEADGLTIAVREHP
jgi:hypothetical protein